MTTPPPAMTHMHSLDVFRHYDRGHWRLAEMPLDEIDRTQVRPEYVILVKSSVIGESKVIVAVHGYLYLIIVVYDV